MISVKNNQFWYTMDAEASSEVQLREIMRSSQNADQNVEMNGERYWVMIAEFSLPCWNFFGGDEFWFQQDGAAEGDTIEISREKCEERA